MSSEIEHGQSHCPTAQGCSKSFKGEFETKFSFVLYINLDVDLMLSFVDVVK